MQHHRNYSYDDAYGHQSTIQHGGYTTSNTSFGHQSTYGHQQSAGQYYGSTQHSVNNTNDQSSQSYQNTLPAMPYGSRYPTEHHSDSRYCHPQGASSLSYGTQSSYYGSHYSSSADHRAHQTQHGAHFIPTPSELTTYASYSRNAGNPQSTSRPPEPHAANSDQTSLRGQAPARIPTSSRSRAGNGTSPTSASGERFPCEKCGKTFSRSHDRKRHHETQHLATPVVHRCQYCEKEFSRADSLKRHLDNGCDEMP